MHRTKHHKISGPDPRAAKRSRSAAGQPAKRSGEYAPDGFLRAEFSDVFLAPAELPDMERAKKELTRSLTWLKKTHHLKGNLSRSLPFPGNAVMLLEKYRTQLRTIKPEANYFIGQDETHTACVSAWETPEQGCDFYYLSVAGIHRLLKDREARKSPKTKLLLSVCAYLYQVARFPFYTEGGAAASAYYTCLDSLRDYQDGYAADPNESQEQLEQLENILKRGGEVLTEFKKPQHIHSFVSRVNRFQPTNDEGHALKNVAQGFLALYRQYPTLTVYSHVPPIPPEEESSDYIPPDYYLCFFWDDDSMVMEMVNDYFNSDMQERYKWIAPTLLRIYDRENPPPVGNLDFDERLFKLLGQLQSFIYQYAYL